MTNSTDKQLARPSPDLTAPIVAGGLVVLALLHFATARTPGMLVWGIDYWRGLPFAVQAGAVLFAILLFIPFVARWIDRAVSRWAQSRWVVPGLIGVAAVLFYVFRSRALSYGDGYTVLSLYTDGRFPILFDQLVTHPLDIVVHWLVNTFVVRQAGGTVATALAIVSVAGGLLSIRAIIRIAGVLAAGRGEVKRFIIAVALTSGAVILWFGYIEAYTLAQAAGLWTLALAIEVPKKPGRLKWAWGVWVVACALHLQAVVLLPALVWATWHTRRGDRARVSRGLPLAWFVGGLLAGAVGSLILRYKGSTIPVVLKATPLNAYSALSGAHLLDVANEILLVAPVAIIALIVLLLPASPESDHKDRDQRHDLRGARTILGIAAVTAWYFAFWVDPLLGAFRDWDLLAVFGIPASLWAAALIAARMPDRRRLGLLWVGVAGIALLHTGGWVAAMQDEMGGALRIDSLVRQDVHYTADFQRGDRLPSWSFILGENLNRYDLAIDHFGLKARITPERPVAWANLGAAYRHMNRFDSSAYCYERASALDPEHAVYLTNIGLLNLWQGNLPAARDAFERQAALSDTSYAARANLGRIYIDLGLPAQADSILREAIAIAPDRPNAYGLLGENAHRLGDTLTAIQLYQTTLEKGGHSEEVYQRLVQLYHWSGRFDEAKATARRWEQLFPSSYTAPLLLGTVFVGMGAYDSANAAFTRSMTLQPDAALPVYYLATTYRHLGRPDRARELAERAAMLDTTLALPLLELVYLADDAGDRAAAVAATRAYLARSPADSSLSYLRQFLEP